MDQSTAEDRDHDEEDESRAVEVKPDEDKLRHALFVLKKINDAFGAYREALHTTQSANERVAAQLSQTEALLNQYVNILSRSDEFSRLVFDEEWEGSQKDEEMVKQKRLEAMRKAKKEAEERALALKSEQERLEREAREKAAREEKERAEKARAEIARNRGSGVRGVRGTRASMRATSGTRNIPFRGRAASSRAR